MCALCCCDGDHSWLRRVDGEREGRVVMLWRLLSWGKGLWDGQKRCDGDCCLGGRDCGRGRRGVMGTAV